MDETNLMDSIYKARTLSGSRQIWRIVIGVSASDTSGQNLKNYTNETLRHYSSAQPLITGDKLDELDTEATI